MLTRHPLADEECSVCHGSGYAPEWSLDECPADEPGRVPCECVLSSLESLPHPVPPITLAPCPTS